MDKIKIGISGCLLGQEIRYNGGHCKDNFIVERLTEFFSFRAVCPELGIGLGVPRPTLQLRKVEGEIRLVETKSNIDHTDAMRAYSRATVKMLRETGVRGFIVKSRSPSCGMERVKCSHKNGKTKDGVGVFTQELQALWPNLPIEEEGRLNDPRLREHFLERVFAFDRWCRFLEEDGSAKGLVSFHTIHKAQCMAHDPKLLKELGRLVACVGNRELELQEVLREYELLFMQILSTKSTVKRHLQVLQYLSGFVKRQVSTEDKQELHRLFQLYRDGYIPLSVPITLLKHHLHKQQKAWTLQQKYLHPYPEKLSLNHYF